MYNAYLTMAPYFTYTVYVNVEGGGAWSFKCAISKL